MPSSPTPLFPKLRAIDIRSTNHNGGPALLLRDPMRLSDKMVLIPHAIAPALMLCDGTRDHYAICAEFEARFGMRLEPVLIQQLVEALDGALLLDNETFERASRHALEEYRQAAFRPPTLAGQVYPAGIDELRSMLQDFLDRVDEQTPQLAEGYGLVSPHIDYARGGVVYATVWKSVSALARSVDLVVVLGTDHYGEEGQLTLTRQHYATPFGILPTACDIIDELAEALGEEQAFTGEIRHHGEHSIELALTWLHYIREGRPCEVVPILCGSFAHFVRGDARPDDDPAIATFLDAVWRTTAGRRTLVIAAADLSHVGPAFGGPPLDHDGRAKLHISDHALIDRVCAGDAAGFFAAIKQVGDCNNICGLSPIYLALRMLGAVQGSPLSYDQCPADEQGTSVVSVCGVAFT